ncbi:5'-3' exonuclease [Lederbergia panacisoli]|uniref:5'-3' exonuclease n=1 Tax=Lederbergia panacisoli TaxID=1255251 RepID=UPI00214C8629|nr:5'-3' exonuclease [Lederbergia panacisoli]MCR2820183.1 5'-3' exonuclease [Lederbergia panacisoli]
MSNPHFLLIDGMALLFRSFYATSVRNNFMFSSKGVPTNAVQGYLKHLLTAVEKFDPTHIAVCWDMGSQTFRNDMFDGYKANRQAPPVEMIPQFDLAKNVTDSLGIMSIGLAGYEADDCIGTISNQYKELANITVLTGDRDLLQIIDDRISVLIMQKGIGNYQHHTKSSFTRDFELHPQQLIDVKALMGDSSDGYPGVKGIGEKTAYKLIQDHKDIEGLLANINSLSPSVQKKINSDLEMLHLSRQLAAIECNVPLSIDFNDTAWNISQSSSMEICEEFELKTVRNHLLKTKWFEEDDLFASKL